VHGLRAGLAQVEDGEPPVTEDDFLTARLPEAATVGSPVTLCGADLFDEPADPIAAWPQRRLAIVENAAYCARNAAHGSLPHDDTVIDRKSGRSASPGRPIVQRVYGVLARIARPITLPMPVSKG
jgi:hypothetical protein